MVNSPSIEEDNQQSSVRHMDVEPSCSRSQSTSGRTNELGNYQVSQVRLPEFPVAMETGGEPTSHHSAPSAVALHRNQPASHLHNCYPLVVKSEFLPTVSSDVVHHNPTGRDNYHKDTGLSKGPISWVEKLAESSVLKEWKRKPLPSSSSSSFLHANSCIPTSVNMGTSKNTHGDYSNDPLTPVESRKKLSDVGSGSSDICHRQCISDIPFKKRLANRSVDIGIVQNPVDVALIDPGLENLINIGIVENPVNIGILKNPNSVENLEGYNMGPLNKVCMENNGPKPVCCDEQVSKWHSPGNSCYKTVKLKTHPARMNGNIAKHLREITAPTPTKIAGNIESSKVSIKHISIPRNCQSPLDKYEKPGCSRYLERDEQIGIQDVPGSSASDFRKVPLPEQRGVCQTPKSEGVDNVRVIVSHDVSHGHNTTSSLSFQNDSRVNKYSNNNNVSNSTYNLKICHNPSTSESSFNFLQVAMYPENVINLDEFMGSSDLLITSNEDPNKKKKIGNIGNTIPMESTSSAGSTSSSSSSSSSSPSTSNAMSSSNSTLNAGNIVTPSPSGRFASVLNLSYNENMDNYFKTGNNECVSGVTNSNGSMVGTGRSVDCVVNLSQHVTTDSCNGSVAKHEAAIDRPSSSGAGSSGIIATAASVHQPSNSHKAVVVNVPNLSAADSGTRPAPAESSQKVHDEQIPNQVEKDLETEFYESVMELENEYNASKVVEGNVSSTPSLPNSSNVDSPSTTTVSVGSVNGVGAATTPKEGSSSDIKCKLCSKTFKYESNLQSHMSAHKRRKCFKCEKCTKTFTFVSDYYQHTLAHHSGLILYSCDYCQEQFLCNSELETHRLTHDGKRPYQCRYCEKNYVRKGDLKKHLRVHSGERPYQCELCGKSFGASSGQLAKHLRIHLDEKPFSCNYCNKTFTDKSNADKHMMFHVGEKLFKCTLCTKAFMQKCDLSRHIRTHTGEKPHTCEFCGKAFSDQSAFSKHRRIHTGEGMLKCTHCDKTFNNPYNRTRHMRLHTRERAFPCDLCDKIFTCNYSVKMHRRIHTGEKPHKCDYCFKTFISSSNLNKHLKTHHPVKAVKYECCGTMYADPAALDEHFKSHGAKQS